MLRIILLFTPLLLLISSCNVGAMAQGQPTEVWPEFTVNYDPIRKVRLMFAIRKETSEETPDQTLEATATVIYRIRPLVRDLLFDDEHDNEKKYMLSLAANYEYSRSFGSSRSSNEHRVMIDATPRYKLPTGTLFENRFRSEFRRRDGGYDFWFRTRARVEHAFKIKRFRFRPYASAEPVWTKNAKAWNRNHLSAGVEIPVILKKAMVDLYYLRKNCDTCSHPDINAIGVNFHLYFGWK